MSAVVSSDLDCSFFGTGAKPAPALPAAAPVSTSNVGPENA